MSESIQATHQLKLAVGDKAPLFTLYGDDGKKHSLSSYRGRHVLVYFYPRAGTPGCTKEACDFQGAVDDFHDLLEGSPIDIVAISPDKPEKLAAFRAKYGLTFPLLSDPEKKVMAEWGAFGEKMNYGKLVHSVIRSTFLVGPRGDIMWLQYNVRATGHVARLLRDIPRDLAEL